MTERRAHFYNSDDTERALCGAKIPWRQSPAPDEAEACLTCDRILSALPKADYDRESRE